GRGGGFVAPSAAAAALVAAGRPPRGMAYALGLVQVAVFTSQTVGPVVGGVLAQAFGFRPTFALGGMFYIVSFVLCFVFVKEDFERPAPGQRSHFFADMRTVMRVPMMLLLVTVMFLVSS